MVCRGQASAIEIRKVASNSVKEVASGLAPIHHLVKKGVRPLVALIAVEEREGGGGRRAAGR